MSMDYSEFEAFVKHMNVSSAELHALEAACANELAARLLRSVVKNTPTGIYPSDSGKVGGTLKRGWTVSAVKQVSGGASVDVLNPIEYASYVEYGHRQEPGRFVPVLGKRLKASWVDGKFMLTDSENQLRPKAQRIVDNKVQAFWEARINGK